MDSRIFSPIPFAIDLEQIGRKLHITKEKPYYPRMLELIEAAGKIGQPKAIYGAAGVESRGDNYVIIDGIKFTSRILTVNLEGSEKAYPYVVTSGRELEAWAAALTDTLDSYIADAINEEVLRSARQNLFQRMDEEFGIMHGATMNPGSLPEWPIKEQVNLFSLLGDVKGGTGVDLTPSHLMMPIKTVSGIRFPKEGTYENCQLCPKQKCPSRKAPYDAGLYEKQYAAGGMD